MKSFFGRRLLILIPSIICFEIFVLVATTKKVTSYYSRENGVLESKEEPQQQIEFERKLRKIRDRLMVKAKAGEGIRITTTDDHNKPPLRTLVKPPANQPLDFRPPILTEPEINNNSVIVVLVPSHQGSFVKRQAIRETWKAAAEKANATATILFVIGQSDCLGFDADFGNRGNRTGDEPPTKTTTELSCEEMEHDFLKMEQDQYHDLLEIPIVEAYTLLSEKMIQAYHWVLTNFRKTKWIAKADDDMFVNVRNLEHYLIKFNPEVPMVIGEIIHNSPVAKEGKWADLEYKRKYYPDWPKGSAGHVLSRRIVEYIVDHSEELYRYQGEDTNIGIWMDEADLKEESVTYVNAKELFGSSGKDLCRETPFQHLIIGHQLSPSDLEYCQTKSDRHGVAEVAWKELPIIYKNKPRIHKKETRIFKRKPKIYEKKLKPL